MQDFFFYTVWPFISEWLKNAWHALRFILVLTIVMGWLIGGVYFGLVGLENIATSNEWSQITLNFVRLGYAIAYLVVSAATAVTIESKYL